jgi:hypothetical protein
MIQALSSVFLLTSSLVLLVQLPTGCGTETGNPVIKKPTTPRVVAQDAVESELMEVSDSALDLGGSSNNLWSAHALMDPSGPIATIMPLGAAAQQTNSCTADGNKVTVVMEKTVNALRRTVERKVTSVWNSPLGAISCAADNTVDRKVRLLEGTSEERSGTVNRSLELPAAAGKNGYQKTASNIQGNWKVLFDSIEVGTSEVKVQKTISWSLKKSESFKTTDGSNTVETETNTSAATPLKVLITRVRDTGFAVKSRLIQSGTTTVKTADGATIEMNFENILVGGNGDCYPSSGFLRGTLTPAGAAAEAFTVDFSQKAEGAPALSFTDGEKIPLSGICFD